MKELVSLASRGSQSGGGVQHTGCWGEYHPLYGYNPGFTTCCGSLEGE